MILQTYKISTQTPEWYKSFLIVLFYGEDLGVRDFFQKILIDHLKITGCQTLTQEDFLQAKKPLKDLISSQGLFSKAEPLLIKGCTDKIGKFLQTFLENPSESDGPMIFLQADYLKPASKLRKLFEGEKNLLCLPCYAPDVSLIARMVHSYLKENSGLKYENAVATACATYLSENLYAFQTELEKLILYCQSKEAITIEDVHAVMLHTEQAKFDGLFEAYLERNVAKMEKSFSALYQDGHTVISLVRLLSHFTQRILQLLSYKKTGGTVEKANQHLFYPFNSFQLKGFLRFLNKWTETDCLKFVKKLEEIELKIKRRSYLNAGDFLTHEIITMLPLTEHR